MGSGKARPRNTRKAEKPWKPRGEPITGFGRWYRDNELPVSHLQAWAECGAGYAYELLNGARVPSLERAVKIIDGTRALNMHGWAKTRTAIVAHDFLPDPG